MPKLGLTVSAETLTECKVEPGQRGEVLFVVETERVANKIEASADGSIGWMRVLAGATVPVDEVLTTAWSQFLARRLALCWHVTRRLGWRGQRLPQPERRRSGGAAGAHSASNRE
jgi:Biotin-requiring enzyme